MADADPASPPLDSPAVPQTRGRIVIIGGGLGGIACAKALARAPVDVTLIDRNNYHLAPGCSGRWSTYTCSSPSNSACR